MREIITQLQPGREGGKQGSGEREGGKGRGGGQRGRGCRGTGEQRRQKRLKGKAQDGQRGCGRGLPPSITRFIGVWKTG